ncbi:hypothetical protein, partial [Porphyromonas gulae]
YPSKAKTGGLTNTKPKRKGAAPKMNFDTAPLRLSGTIDKYNLRNRRKEVRRRSSLLIAQTPFSYFCRN